MLWLGILAILLFLAFVIQTLIRQNELAQDRERITRLMQLETRSR